MTGVGAIFDLDGVIVSTDKYHRQAWEALARELGIPFSEEQARATRGVDRMASLRVVLGPRWDEFGEGERIALASKKNELYVKLIGGITPKDALPGAVELVEALAAEGIPRAIGSASKNALPVLERLGIASLFSAIVTGFDFTRGKPAPDVFLVAAERMGIPPQQCVVFEDAQAGIQAAHSGGMKAFGVGDPEIVAGCDRFSPSLAGVTVGDIIELAGMGKAQCGK